MSLSYHALGIFVSIEIDFLIISHYLPRPGIRSFQLHSFMHSFEIKNKSVCHYLLFYNFNYKNGQSDWVISSQVLPCWGV
jgi:hypothetical protein